MPQIESPSFEEQPRPVSVGEAEVKLAATFKQIAWFVGLYLSPQEETAVATLCGALIRRWPWLEDWAA